MTVTLAGNHVRVAIHERLAIADFNGDGNLDFVASVLGEDIIAPRRLLLFERMGLLTFCERPWKLADMPAGPVHEHVDVSWVRSSASTGRALGSGRSQAGDGRIIDNGKGHDGAEDPIGEPIASFRPDRGGLLDHVPPLRMGKNGGRREPVCRGHVRCGFVRCGQQSHHNRLRQVPAPEGGEGLHPEERI